LCGNAELIGARFQLIPLERASRTFTVSPHFVRFELLHRVQTKPVQSLLQGATENAVMATGLRFDILAILDKIAISRNFEEKLCRH
jgi:hypothetical protein